MQRLFSALKRLSYLRGLSAAVFAAAAAHFLADLNAIHPSREGNGRTQTIFLMLVADYSGHPLTLERLEPKRFRAAMIESFHGNERPLAAEIRSLIG